MQKIYMGTTQVLSIKIYFYDNWTSTITFQIFNGIDTVKPSLSGLEPVTVDTFSIFNPLKDVTAIDDIDGDISDRIYVDGVVHTDVEGTYSLLYAVRDQAGNETSQTRTVEVKDMTAPNITVPTSTIIYADLPFDPLKDVTAIDAYAGNVSATLTTTKSINPAVLGNQEIVYRANDKQGNFATAVRTVTVQETPDFGLRSIKDTAILIDSAFDPLAGITLTEHDQEVKNIHIDGTVDIHKTGVYPLQYSFLTTTNQVVTKVRPVYVVDDLTPSITGIDNKTITYGTAFDPLQGVGAVDATGAKVSNVSASYGGDITQPGTHVITYHVTDDAGRTLTKERTLTVTKPINNFSDVPQSHHAFKEIEAMKARGIINGYEDGTFRPATNISRQHVAALIYRSGIALPAIRPATTFHDVPKTHRYYNEIMTLYRAGIIDGSNGNFNPNGVLTRAQLSKILVNAFNLKLQPDNVLVFSDVKNGWAKSYIDILSSNDITTGSNGQFMPAQPVSRLHYTLFMYRILN